MCDTNNEINVHYPNNMFPLDSKIINTDSIDKKNSHSSPEIRPKHENVLSNTNSFFNISKSAIKAKSNSSSDSNTLFNLANEVKDCDSDSLNDNNLFFVIL